MPVTSSWIVSIFGFFQGQDQNPLRREAAQLFPYHSADPTNLATAPRGSRSGWPVVWSRSAGVGSIYGRCGFPASYRLAPRCANGAASCCSSPAGQRLQIGLMFFPVHVVKRQARNRRQVQTEKKCYVKPSENVKYRVRQLIRRSANREFADSEQHAGNCRANTLGQLLHERY